MTLCIHPDSKENVTYFCRICFHGLLCIKEQHSGSLCEVDSIVGFLNTPSDLISVMNSEQNKMDYVCMASLYLQTSQYNLLQQTDF